jgi:hypothetical protein
MNDVESLTQILLVLLARAGGRITLRMDELDRARASYESGAVLGIMGRRLGQNVMEFSVAKPPQQELVRILARVADPSCLVGLGVGP